MWAEVLDWFILADLWRLLLKANQICSSEVKGCILLSAEYKHPTSLNFAWLFKMERLSGACLVNVVRNVRWTRDYNSVLAYSRMQINFHCFVNDIIVSEKKQETKLNLTS